MRKKQTVVIPALPKATPVQIAELPRILNEKNYSYEMDQLVESQLDTIVRRGHFSSRGTQGRQLYYELFPQENNIGTIVFCHGLTESCLKYHEMIYYFYQMGYQIAMMDHRGHGLSFRLQEDTSIIDVDHFSNYVNDFHTFVRKVVLKKLDVEPERFYLFAHSMGGCIATRYCERYPDDFAKLLLNAPMMGIDYGKVPEFVIRAICLSMIVVGKGKQRIFNQSAYQTEPDFENSCCNSEARYLNYHEKRIDYDAYRSNGVSYRWGLTSNLASHKARCPREIGKLKMPILMIVAGNDELVSRGAQEEFLAKRPETEVYEVPSIKHEIFRGPNEVLGDYFCVIKDFFQED